MTLCIIWGTRTRLCSIRNSSYVARFDSRFRYTNVKIEYQICYLGRFIRSISTAWANLRLVNVNSPVTTRYLRLPPPKSNIPNDNCIKETKRIKLRLKNTAVTEICWSGSPFFSTFLAETSKSWAGMRNTQANHGYCIAACFFIVTLHCPFTSSLIDSSLRK